MLTPVQIVERLSVDEFIGLCNAVAGNFDVIDIYRDENLDPEVFVQLRKGEVVKVKVKAWPLSA